LILGHAVENHVLKVTDISGAIVGAEDLCYAGRRLLIFIIAGSDLGCGA
jgi:hypothetical protein